MIVWNLNKWFDKLLVSYTEQELRELFEGQLVRRKMLMRLEEAKKAKKESERK